MCSANLPDASPHPCTTSSMPLWCPYSLYAQVCYHPVPPIWCFISNEMYSVSQKKSPCGVLIFYPKWTRIFNQFLHTYYTFQGRPLEACCRPWSQRGDATALAVCWHRLSDNNNIWRNKCPLTFSSNTPRWKCRFTQKLQRMYKRWQRKIRYSLRPKTKLWRNIRPPYMQSTALFHSI